MNGKKRKRFYSIIIFLTIFWCDNEASYFDRINMTKNWKLVGIWPKNITPTNMNIGTWPKDYTDEHEHLNMTNFGLIQPFMFVVVHFFGHVQKLNVRRCDLCGHLQVFWSYSLGHVESVKWFNLVVISHQFEQLNNKEEDTQTHKVKQAMISMQGMTDESLFWINSFIVLFFHIHYDYPLLL